MGFNLSSNMNLPVPQVGNEAGPQYATDVNNCLTLVDQHNHSPGYGVAINPNGININADLPMNTNNLTLTRTVRFAPQTTVLTAPADIGCLYEVVNDLYYNDGLGNNIRLTQAGSIAGTSGSIANLTPPASATYVSINQTIVFQSNTNVAANLDAGFIILRTAAANSPGLTLQAPASIASNYSISLPLLPASNLPVSIDSSGNMSAAQITSSQIDPAFVNAATTTQVAYVSDVKGSGVSGGAAVSGSWLQRDLNTLANPGGYTWITAPGSNQFTLAAGTYKISGHSFFDDGVNACMAKLVNVTDASDLLLGTTGHAQFSSASFFYGVFTIAATKTIEVQYQVNSSQTEGLGVASAFGSNNTYTVVEIQKITL